MAEQRERPIWIRPDTSRPPPPLPPSYKTMLYPAYADRLSKNIPAENQMRDISLSRKSAEHVMFMNAKRKNYHKIRSANENQTRYCNICSEFIMPGDYTSSIVHHTHNSSKAYRISSPADRWGNYPCITCKSTPHSHKIGVRYPVLVSSSILINWQGIRSMSGYEGDEIHIDYQTIPGATVRELEHAFMAEYGNVHRAVDVLLVAGLNDILRGATDHEILEDIQHFRDSVKSISARSGELYQGSFAAATLPFPPKITVIKDAHRKIVNDRKDLMISLTSMIREFNRSGNHYPVIPTRLAPCFHTWGIRTKKSSTSFTGPRMLMEGWINHRLGSWRETKPKDMLHLDDSVRIRMGKTCLGYFKAIYRITECKAKSKNEGLMLLRFGTK